MAKSDPFWWEDVGRPASPPEVSLPAEVDVLVIGAGLTGLSAARTLGQRGKSVLVLDALAPGEGASSRSGGMIGGGHRLSVDEMTAQFGDTIAHAMLREAHLDSGEFCLGLMAEETIQCDYVETGRYRAVWSPKEYETSARELERLQKLIPLEAEMIPKARQHEEIATGLYAGGTVFPRHGGLNPAKWVAGLMSAAQRAGAVVQGHTPVTALTRDSAVFLAATPRGTVRAGQVLAATNGYTPGAIAALRRRIIPVPSFIVVTEDLGKDRVRSLFPNLRMIVETRERHCYYRPSPDGTRIVFGGRAAMFDVSESFAQKQLYGLLTQIFPDLKGVGLTHNWRGSLGFCFDFLPHVGQIDEVWYAMGYSGNGNTMAPYLGHKAALRMLGDPEGDTAFARIDMPTRWWHRGSPWFLPFADVTFRARDIWRNLQKGA